MPEEITPPAPRIVVLAGAPHPKALIQSVDAVTGLCLFAWLNAAGEQVDTGGSVARFTVEWQPGEEPGTREYLAPTDAELAAAIANPPPYTEPVPAAITPRQLRLHLLALGITDAVVRSQLAGNDAALIEWEYPQEVKRTHPLVGQLGAALGLNSAQIDAAFRAAAQL